MNLKKLVYNYSLSFLHYFATKIVNIDDNYLICTIGSM